MTRKKILIITIVVLLVAGGFYISQINGNNYQEYTIQERTLGRSLSFIGNVEPIDKIDLGFLRSGLVSQINVEKNDPVKSGDVLASLDANELIFKRKEAQASLGVEQATLEQLQIKLQQEEVELQELQKGTRQEELLVSQTKRTAAQTDVQNALTSLQDVREKAGRDLEALYKNSLPIIQKSLIVAKNGLLTLTDLQFTYFNNGSVQETLLRTAKEFAIARLFDEQGSGGWNQETLSVQDGGLFLEYEKLVESKDYDLVVDLINETITALNYTVDALNTFPIDNTFSDTDKTNLASEKKLVNDQLSRLASQQESISSQIVENTKAINTAMASLNTARDDLAIAESDFDLLSAGTVQEKLDKQKLKVQEAEANILKQQAFIQKVQALIDQYQVQISQSNLVSSIDGVITEVSVEKGEVVSLGEPHLSVISDNQFEVIIDVPEIHIDKIRTEQTAEVWFDAFGQDKLFEMAITKIDPAETIIEGIVTYKVHLVFDNTDQRIKSGMTANVLVGVNRKESVLAIPQDYIQTGNQGEKGIMIKRGDDLEFMEVEFGLTGDDGYIEIITDIPEETLIVK